MLRCALMLVLVLASAANAEELAPHTRALLHEALEARLTLPTEPPSLQRPLPAPRAAGARESSTAAMRAGQNAAANQAAEDVANGRGRHGDPSESARNAAGQARAAEARATGGNGAVHGNPHGSPPGKDKGGK